jgi:hypothetical protein
MLDQRTLDLFGTHAQFRGERGGRKVMGRELDEPLQSAREIDAMPEARQSAM